MNKNRLLTIVLFLGIVSCKNVPHAGDAALLKYDGGGEIQSTIIPPGVRPDCPHGRFLLSRDGYRPSSTGLVVSRDLDSPGTAALEATFDVIPDAQDYLYCTNDHDLLTLPNGDVLYITGAMSKRPVIPKPAWFGNTYRGAFGPGTRSVVLTWKSTDGGKSFQYLSEFDPVNVEGGIGASPQFGASKINPPWDAGGSDGQLVIVAPDGSNRLYMTFGIVGYNPIAGLATYQPDTNQFINKTILLTSINGGLTWTSLGLMEGDYWRLGMVPLNNDGMKARIAFGAGTSLFIGEQIAPLHYAFNPGVEASPGAAWGWPAANWLDTNLKKYIYANIWTHTIIAKAPGNGNNIVMAFPAVKDKGNGSRLFFYNADSNSFAEAAPIVPTDKGNQACVMHPTFVSSGKGPLLIYWYDVTGPEAKCRIKGRIITGVGKYSSDFVISMADGHPYSFQVTKTAAPKFFGDYHTAAGYTGKPVSSGAKTIFKSHFYPIWNESGDTIRYSDVVYSWETPMVAGNLNLGDQNLEFKDIPPGAWKKVTGTIALKNITSAPERRQLENYPRKEETGRNRR